MHSKPQSPTPITGSGPYFTWNSKQSNNPISTPFALSFSVSISHFESHPGQRGSCVIAFLSVFRFDRPVWDQALILACAQALTQTICLILHHHPHPPPTGVPSSTAAAASFLQDLSLSLPLHTVVPLAPIILGIFAFSTGRLSTLTPALQSLFGHSLSALDFLLP